MNRYAIIVAGGSGVRMGTELPKQFLMLEGRPLLMLTLEAFSGTSPGITLILVLPESHIPYWKELCINHRFTVKHSLVAGGNIRGESVKNGLETITATEALVAVHDGVRPFVSPQTIEKAFTLAAEHGASTAVSEITDSVRIVENGENRPFDRTMIRSIQTPQCFRLSLLREAYRQKDLNSFTDDAGLVGNLGHEIVLFDGNPENIKITTPFDLKIAAAILENQHEKEHGSS